MQKDKKITRHCDCCVYANNSWIEKEVEYCSFCNAYICEECKPKIFKRIYASFMRFITDLI